MSAIIFIGDELTAAGFRLAGIETMLPVPEAVGEALAEARGRAALVIMTAGFAANVAASDLEAALLAEVPILAIVPDVLFHNAPPDLTRRLRSALGIEN
jgi:vacuolar-type H+-ATPase subunit F/Vma7